MGAVDAIHVTCMLHSPILIGSSDICIEHLTNCLSLLISHQLNAPASALHMPQRLLSIAGDYSGPFQDCCARHSIRLMTRSMNLIRWIAFSMNLSLQEIPRDGDKSAKCKSYG